MKALHFLSITLLSIISCMSIIACSNDDSDKKNDEVVTITPLGNSQRYFDNGLTFTSQSGSENIEFTCNGDWNVSVANTIGGETWCTVTPANGKAGEGGFTVNVVENKCHPNSHCWKYKENNCCNSKAKGCYIADCKQI